MSNISTAARVGLDGMNPVAQRYGLGSLIDACGGVTEGNSYYVDGNVQFNGDGTSWDSPYSTLTEALAASHANIADSIQRGWAWRNKIYVKGDDLVEDLDLIAQKTDIIGVGSSDPYAMPCVRGNHVPANAAGGCRFINIRFRPTASEDLWILGTTTMGIEFLGCLFDAHYSTFTAPSAIDTTACQAVRIEGNEFLGAFSAGVIDIGAGRADKLLIKNNVIRGGASHGIICTGTPTTVQGRNIIIDKNLVQVAGKTIDDAATAIVFVTDNRCISAAALGANSHVITAATAAGNIVTGNDNTLDVPIKAV